MTPGIKGGGRRARRSWVLFSAVLPFLFAMSVQAADRAAGLDSAPFGFRCGMTDQQVIGLAGKATVKELAGGVLEVDAAAEPGSLFTSYSLLVTAKRGVVMINALGLNANASPGADPRDAFTDLRERLSGIYGAPDQNLDLAGKATFAVIGGENAAADSGPRHWVAVWNLKPPLREHLQGIVLDAEQASGFFFLSYECAGIEVVSEKAKVSALSQKSVPTAFLPATFTAGPAVGDAAPAVVGAAAGASGTEHQVQYKVMGSYVTSPVDITYRNAAGGTVKVTAKLPWTLTFAGQPGQALSLSVYNPIDFGNTWCSIYLDGVLLSNDSDWGVGTISAKGRVPLDGAD